MTTTTDIDLNTIGLADPAVEPPRELFARMQRKAPGVAGFVRRAS